MRWSRDRVMAAYDVERRFARLLPCPFCGSPDVGLYVGPASHVTCGGCGADGPLIEGVSGTLMLEICQGRAVAAWNTRTDRA